MLLGELRSVSKLFQIPRYNHFIIYRVRYSLTLSLLNLSCTFVTQNQTDNHIVNYLNTSRHQLGANERQISSKYFESMSVLSKNHPISLKLFPIILRTATHSGSTSMLCRINQLEKLATIKQLTQKSCCSFSRCAKSSKAIVQLATKSSGGMAASWNTVKPIFFALVTSWVNVSFHVGSNVFALVVERSVEKIKKNHEINGRKAMSYEVFSAHWIFAITKKLL